MICKPKGLHKRKKAFLCAFFTVILLLYVLFLWRATNNPSEGKIDAGVVSKGNAETVSSTPKPKTNSVNNSKCDYKFACTCPLYEDNDADVQRLLTWQLEFPSTDVTIMEYAVEELNNTPAISGGLYTDRQDLDKPRDGEKYVTFAEYLDCLGRNLRVDYRNQREENLTNAEVQQSFPYVVSMGTFELGDMKTLMCNITVPIQHMMYVINSDVTSLTNFFHDVEKAFNFTQRLRIHWPGYNMGFSGAVNFAMRDAMRYPFDEVPFFFILNNDIRFPDRTLRASLPEFRRVTRKDKAVLEGLRAEVAKEPSEYTPLDRLHPLLRSSDNSTLLVTSPSLPDRIRYMPYEERKKIFGKHHGGLFFDAEYDAAAFGMSRLAIETVGFMDENFYPAYYEDTDWRHREKRLGFDDFYVEGVPFKVHYVNALYKLGRRYMLRPSSATQAETFAKYITNVIATVPYYHLEYMKYGTEKEEEHDAYYYCHELPLDAWVMNVPRRRAFMEALHESKTFYSNASISEEVKKEVKNIIDWRPYEQRHRIARLMSGEPLSKVIARAFRDCKLVRHDSS